MMAHAKLPKRAANLTSQSRCRQAEQRSEEGAAADDEFKKGCRADRGASGAAVNLVRGTCRSGDKCKPDDDEHEASW